MEGIKEIRNAPLLSAKSGFYEDAFELSIYASEGNRIYYTLDGSKPNVHSIRYTKPIWIRYGGGRESRITNVRNTHLNWKNSDGESHFNIATVVRAIAVNTKGAVSDIATATYFAGVTGYEDKLVISIVADPEDLFGNNGIYVTGKEYDDWYMGGQSGSEPIPNFRKHGKEWERQVVLEMFCGSVFLQQSVGIRIHGGASRDWKANKRFSIYARKKYSGDSWFSKHIFGSHRTHSFLLRSGDMSGHIVWSGFINGYIQQLVQDRDVTAAKSREAVVCLNGARWYATVIQEKYSRKYFQEKYGINADNIIIVKDGKVNSGKEEDQKLYDDIYHFLNEYDISDDEAYKKFGQLIDIQSYIDFSCVNVYFGNLDYSEEKNIVCWRSRDIGKRRYEDGRWRWALYDMDLENTGYGVAMEEIDTFTTVGYYVGSSFCSRPMYLALKQNSEFRKQFVLSFMDMVNTDFTVKRTREAMDKWGASMILGSKYSDWPENYFPVRTKVITGYLAKEFGLKESVEVISLSTNEVDAGSIVINTITPELIDGTWSGRYFTCYPVTVSVETNRGYAFCGWQLKYDNKTEESLARTIVRRLPIGGLLMRALFKKIVEKP